MACACVGPYVSNTPCYDLTTGDARGLRAHGGRRYGAETTSTHRDARAPGMRGTRDDGPHKSKRSRAVRMQAVRSTKRQGSRGCRGHSQERDHRISEDPVVGGRSPEAACGTGTGNGENEENSRCGMRARQAQEVSGRSRGRGAPTLCPSHSSISVVIYVDDV